MNHINWDTFFMSLVYLVAMKSKDRSTHVGCVVVDDNNTIRSLGYNGFPRGVDDEIEERHDRPAKYLYTEHAERNAVYNARTDLSGCIVYVNFLPCADCARAIIQAGIKEVVVHKKFSEAYQTNQFDESHKATLEMLNEVDINVIWWDGEVVTQIVGFVGGDILSLN